MNVSCPECTTVFRVDPAKVPERGVRARCSVCGGLIAVRRPSVGLPAVPPLPPPPPPPPVAARAVEAPVAPPPPPPPVMPYSAVPEPAVTATVAPPVMPYSAVPEPAGAAPSPTVPEQESVSPPPPPPATPTAMGSGHFSNPFLQQDPGTRARRLARALVSDLVVYHPDKRQRGLADGTLKELFAEEIRKSWEEYSEQIGEQVARESNYFTEALNEILAEGRPIFS